MTLPSRAEVTLTSSQSFKVGRLDYYKRWFDLILMFLAHVLLLPLWLLLWITISLAIFLESGFPILYRHPSVGFGGRVFYRLKFRTMLNNSATDHLFYTQTGDSRITAVGRMLRKTALDELPQIINILKGDMSFVGPRALGVKMHEYCTKLYPKFPLRLQVLPGLTGLAQLHSDRLSPAHKLRYDLLYVRRMSPLLDIKIMLLSVVRTLLGRWDS